MYLLRRMRNNELKLILWLCVALHKGKSGEKALNNFQEFIQMTQHIGEADLNLEFVKDMYTFKMDTLPSSKEMLDNFQRILSKYKSV